MQEPVTSGRTLQLEARSEGKHRVLKVSGQLTETETAEFLEALKREMKSGSPRLILDMDGLQYMSSAGLGALVSMHPAFLGAGVRLIVAGTNSKVRKLLTLTSLDKLIESADSVEEAIGRP